MISEWFAALEKCVELYGVFFLPLGAWTKWL